jgi:mono/diheme cytochrome c family protein
MIAWHDCIALCGFSEDEVRAIAEHEHVPDVVTAGLASSLLMQAHGVETVRHMINDDIRAASDSGDYRLARDLLACLQHFLMKAPLVFTAMTACLFVTEAAAEEVGDKRAGRIYAQAHCGECHGVESADEISPQLDAPNFVSVANTPGMTARALAVWLQTSHPNMPNFMIPDEQKDNVIAYIMSLRSPSAP